MSSLSVIFMGTPAFALPALEAVLASPHRVLAIYTQPPRPAGRGQKLTPSPIHQRAEEAGIPVHTPLSLKSEEAQAGFAAYRADIALVAAYGLLLPPAILAAPRLGCINIHPSALPRWRGAAPLQRTLMAGDTQTACCIMQMEAGLDTGPVLLREDVAIPADMNAGALHDLMAALGARLAVQALDVLATGPLPAQIQSEEGVTYAAKITKDDQRIDWTHTASTLHDQIRGLSPAPGAQFVIGGEPLKLFVTALSTQTTQATPGTLLDAQGHVACGEGSILQLIELQRPGKSRAAAADVLRGMQVAIGQVLS